MRWPHVPVRMIVERQDRERLLELPRPNRTQMMKVTRTQQRKWPELPAMPCRKRIDLRPRRDEPQPLRLLLHINLLERKPAILRDKIPRVVSAEENLVRGAHLPQLMRIRELANHRVVARRLEVRHDEAEKRIHQVPRRPHIKIQRHQVVPQVILRLVVQRRAIVGVGTCSQSPMSRCRGTSRSRGDGRAPRHNPGQYSDRAARRHAPRMN